MSAHMPICLCPNCACSPTWPSSGLMPCTDHSPMRFCDSCMRDMTPTLYFWNFCNIITYVTQNNLRVWASDVVFSVIMNMPNFFLKWQHWYEGGIHSERGIRRERADVVMSVSTLCRFVTLPKATHMSRS